MNTQLPPPRPTVAALIPAKWRQAIYAVLAVGHAGYVAAEAAYDLPVWTVIVLAMVDAAGFSLAAANTEVGR